HEAVRKLRRLEKDGIPFLPDEDLLMPMMTFAPAEIKKTVEWLASRRKDADASLIALAPGCKTSANAWPVESFIEIGSRLMAAKKCEIIVVGGEAEREMGDRMVERWGSGINSAGDFSVRESGALLSRCDIYIGLDTGTTHLAAVAGTRCFAIYGERNNPGHWFPLGNGHAVLFHPVKCAGCRLQDCPIPDHPCMTGITIDAVWHNLQEFLKRNPADSETRIISV
ncbi:MAG: glycosyltransferase family 9 protein, partial [Pyrinomonadaceae bacterium]